MVSCHRSPSTIPSHRSFTRDPIDYSDSWSLYQLLKSDPLNQVDPSGMQTGDNVEVAARRRVLYATIAGWRTAGHKCAADLMASWLSKKPDTCPSSCIDALNRNGYGFINGCLASRLAFNASCPGTTTTNFTTEGDHYFKPEGLIPIPGPGDDLAYGFGHFHWKASGKCVSNCTPTKNCCCSCTGSCGYELTTGPDPYDFKKEGRVYPHPLYCAWLLGERGGLKPFSVTCRTTVYAQPITFDRCPGPGFPMDRPCEKTMQTGNSNVVVPEL